MVLGFLSKPGGHVIFMEGVMVVPILVVVGVVVVRIMEEVLLLERVQMYEPSVLWQSSPKLHGDCKHSSKSTQTGSSL